MIRGHFASVLFLVKRLREIFNELVIGGLNSVPQTSRVLLEVFESQLKRLEAQAIGVRSFRMSMGSSSSRKIFTDK